jgi:thymidylate synthase
MNKLDKQYTDLLQDILDNGVKKQDRTGTGTISVFGRQIRHDMKDGFPLLTTKKMPFKTIVTELLWFLRGDTNIKYLVDNGCNIWNGDAYKNYENNWLKENPPMAGPYTDPCLTMKEFIDKIKNDKEFSDRFGNLGPIYGKQWRSWTAMDTSEIKIHTYKIDQIQNLINDLKTNPDSRRLMVNAWNVGELDQMVLPPCHYGFQVYTRELSEQERINLLHIKNGNKGHHIEAGFNMLDEFDIPTRAISLMWNQRSVDTFLGLPFNIASYGLLLEIISKEVNMVPDQLIGNLGDVHLYSNHIDAAKEQIGRELTYDEKVEYARSLYGKEEWWDINDKRVIVVLQKKKRTREPFPLPMVKLSSGHNLRAILKGNFEEIEISDIILINYQSHPVIKAPLSN